MNEQREMTVDEKQLMYIDLLFSQYLEHDPPEDLRVISKYFEHLGEQINYRPPYINVSNALLMRFESVCLVLRDRLSIYPDTVHAQVEQILKDSGLERMFAVMAALSIEEVKRTEIHGMLGRAIRALPSLFRPELNQDVISVPTRQAMFEAKIALNRIAQILRYASSIEVADYDKTTNDLKDHYDPSLIDKWRIVALLNVLRVQTNNVSDMGVQKRLLENIDRIEQEIKRPKPRWGRIIATAFVLFGFLADLKTLNPTIYDSLYRTAHAIVNILHVEGSVEEQRRKPLLPMGDETPSAILPSLPELPGRNEDDEDVV